MINQIPIDSLRRIFEATAILFAMISCGHGAERIIDSAMDNDPKLPIPGVIYAFSPELKSLWLKALAQPEGDLKRQAADAIAHAHKLGMKGLQDTVPELRKSFQAANANPVVRLAIARTLIVLDARDSAPILYRHLENVGAEYALAVEPALAHWDYRPIRKLWLARLSDSRSRPSLLRLAIRGLAAVEESGASVQLWQLAGDSKMPAMIRIDAAKALGRIETKGLLERATGLAKDRSPQHLINGLVAALLLERHEGKEAEEVLLKLAADPQPAVAAIAIRRLMTINPQRARTIADSLLQRRDAKLRHLGCKSLAGHPTASSVKLLSPVLNDPHPEIRNLARAALADFAARPELASLIRTEAMRVLAGDNWRGHEQSSLLLAQLNHKPAAKRLVELLESKRPEIMEASAWALRKLAVPEMLPAMLDKARRESAKDRELLTTSPNAFPDAMTPKMGRTAQLVHLFQSFGQMKYKPAIPLLWKFVPKSDFYQGESRAAAVWALGFLETGPGAKRLAATLAGRLADVSSLPPETERVRWMSAVSLGRLKAREQVPVLRRYYRIDSPQSGVGLACRWAIHEITNEALPGSKMRTKSVTNWFLEPILAP